MSNVVFGGRGHDFTSCDALIAVVERTDEYVALELIWKDGSPPTSCEVKLVGHARRRIAEMAGKLPPAEIAEALNAEGLTTKYDTPWTANAVWLVTRRLPSEQRQE